MLNQPSSRVVKATCRFIERAYPYAVATAVTVPRPEFQALLGINGPLHNTGISRDINRFIGTVTVLNTLRWAVRGTLQT